MPGFEPITLGQLADRAARDHGHREFLSFNGHRETFAETLAASERLARGLMALGVAAGDKVSLWMTNRPEWVHAAIALAKIGAVMVPINTRFRTDDLDYVLRQSDTSTLLLLEQSGPVHYLDMVRELCPELASAPDARNLRCAAFPELRRVINLGEAPRPGTIDWSAAVAAADSVPESALRAREAAVRPADTLFIMYTSGTTGFPKGAMQSHAVVRNATATAKLMALTPDDCTIMFLPLFHAFGYYEGILVSLVAGSRMPLVDVFNPRDILALIESEKGTIIHGFDTHWQDLIDCPHRPHHDLSSLRSGILAAGLPSTVPVAERANAQLCPTMTGWGMTEVMPGALINHFGDDPERSINCSGYPNEGYEFKIIDADTGAEMPVGKPGEMLVRGYAVMQGYYKKPEETAKSIDKDGWFHTGDMGVRREDGYYRFLGRYKEMLKVGGENVDPVEVEAYFLRHPAVSKIQVVGVADHRLSEIPVGFVVLSPGASATEEELSAFAHGKVASFKIPKRFFFVDEYPMTSTGKVKRFELRADAKQRLGIVAEDIEKAKA